VQLYEKNTKSLPHISYIVTILLNITYFIYIPNNVNEKTLDTATIYMTTISSIVIGAMISVIIYNDQQNNKENRKEMNYG